MMRKLEYIGKIPGLGFTDSYHIIFSSMSSGLLTDILVSTSVTAVFL